MGLLILPASSAIDSDDPGTGLWWDHFVPNRNITVVSNLSRGDMRADRYSARRKHRSRQDLSGDFFRSISLNKINTPEVLTGPIDFRPTDRKNGRYSFRIAMTAQMEPRRPSIIPTINSTMMPLMEAGLTYRRERTGSCNTKRLGQSPTLSIVFGLSVKT